MVADYMPHKGNKTVDRPKQVRDFKDGINDKFNDTIWEDSGYGVPRGSSTNAPDQHPRWLDRSEQRQARKMGKSRPTKRLPDGTQSYKTPDGSPSKHIRPS